ncbi:putative frg1-like family protein [Phaeomoniella chlamydospora]|uniref:Putative frg1-like family protein n=1 Tax=Phaeomoniella chlamydospora TaxID=158046 RepID=A0A0G2GGN2_PHACM|nr:putative frg1-like family protein [Phaeomoniella chlamydospora]
MVKPLTFKGDKPKKSSKKRKLDTDDTPTLSSDQNSTQPSEDDTWTTAPSANSLSGPTLIVLPTTPPTALATDANGSIFAAELENLIDGHPGTAEPHDVRTVWVVGKIPGAVGSAGMSSAAKKARLEASRGGKPAKEQDEDTGVELCFKSCYGNYLGVDGSGKVKATNVAVGKGETFKVYDMMKLKPDEKVDRKNPDPRFVIQTSISPTSTTSSPEDDSGKPSQIIRPFNMIPTTSSSTPPPSQNYLTITQSTSSSPMVSIQTHTSPPPTTNLILRLQTRFLHPSTTTNTNTSGSIYNPPTTSSASTNPRISRSELEKEVGRNLTDEEVKKLKKAYKRGELREEMLNIRVKGGRDKFAF